MDHDAPIGNYYGTPLCRERDGKFWFVLEDWSGEDKVEVSKMFFEAWVTEFKDNQSMETET